MFMEQPPDLITGGAGYIQCIWKSSENGACPTQVVTSKLTGTASEEDAAEWEDKLTKSRNYTVAQSMTSSDMAGV